MNNRVEHLKTVRQMPQIRVKNMKNQYKVAAKLFSPDSLLKEEEPTHVRQSRL